MDISISDHAVSHLRDLGLGGPKFLRIGVTPGGCSGMTYSASIDSTLNEGDEVVLEQGDIRLITDAGSSLFIDGLEIDYSDDLVQAGFRFRNPLAKKSCGCGSSFGV